MQLHIRTHVLTPYQAIKVPEHACSCIPFTTEHIQALLNRVIFFHTVNWRLLSSLKLFTRLSSRLSLSPSIHQDHQHLSDATTSHFPPVPQERCATMRRQHPSSFCSCSICFMHPDCAQLHPSCRSGTGWRAAVQPAPHAHSLQCVHPTRRKRGQSKLLPAL